METTVRLALDTRKNSQRKNDNFPLILRVRHLGKNGIITLGRSLSIPGSGWNDRKREVRGGVDNVGRIKAITKEKLRIAQAVIDTNYHLLRRITKGQLCQLIREALENPNTPLTPSNALEQIEASKFQGITLKKWLDIIVLRKETAKAFGTANWYKNGVKALLKFCGDEDLLLRNITKVLLEDFKAAYQGQGRELGGLNIHLRAIRSLLNTAVDEDQLEPNRNPFIKTQMGKRKVKIPSSRSKKRAVDAKIMASFRRLYHGERVGNVVVVETLKGTKKEFKGQNVRIVTKGGSDWHCICEALFMWETAAMNFVDLVKVRVEDVINVDVIEYNRSKNGSEVKMMTSDLSREIAAQYAKGKSPGEYLFRYGWQSDKIGYDRYSQHRKRWNARMNALAKKMGYENIKFTTYALRHTYATYLNHNGISRDEIAQLYGHHDDRSIGTYIDKVNPRILAQKAQGVLSQLFADQ